MKFDPEDPSYPLHAYLDLLEQESFGSNRSLEDNEKPFLRATGIYIDVNGPQYRAGMTQALNSRWRLVQGMGGPAKDPALLFSPETLARGDIHVVSTMDAIREAYDDIRIISYRDFPHGNGRAQILYRRQRKKALDFIRSRTVYLLGAVSFRQPIRALS